MEIPFDDPKTVQTILSGSRQVGELQDFHLAHLFIQENGLTEDEASMVQSMPSSAMMVQQVLKVFDCFCL